MLCALHCNRTFKHTNKYIISRNEQKESKFACNAILELLQRYYFTFSEHFRVLLKTNYDTLSVCLCENIWF